MQDMGFPWSDSWWIEENRAWFSGGNINFLFCVNMSNEKCDIVTQIPECNVRDYRLYSYCIKYKDIIFCIPDMGTCIWCFDEKKSIWEKIEVGNEDELLFCVSSYKQNFGFIWLLEAETGSIFEVNLEKKVVEKEYHIPRNRNLIVGEYVLVERKLYCANGYNVYCINIDNGEIGTYEVSGAKAELYTICFDGLNFWLSGVCKEIYVWNPIQGIIKTINDFPEKFGFYHFIQGEIPFIDNQSFYSTEFVFFVTSLSLGKYIWYIPFRANEIIYIDKVTYEVRSLEVEEERETEESINAHIMAHKYMVQYIREDRYIGVYSVKNKWIFEIDTIKLCVIKKCYELSDQAFLYIAKAVGEYNEELLFRENREQERRIFSIMLKEGSSNTKDFFHDIGKYIYQTLND